MYKVAIIGDMTSVYGFACLGIEIFPITDAGLAVEKIKQLAIGEYAVIFVIESVYARVKEHISPYRETALPAIIPIPGVVGNTDEGMNEIKKYVEQAIGTDIN